MDTTTGSDSARTNPLTRSRTSARSVGAARVVGPGVGDVRAAVVVVLDADGGVSGAAFRAGGTARPVATSATPMTASATAMGVRTGPLDLISSTTRPSTYAGRGDGESRGQQQEPHPGGEEWTVATG